jgi:hypothetical protein
MVETLMDPRQTLQQMVKELPDEVVRQIVDFAEYVAFKIEREEWQEFGRMQLACLYGPDEPEYTEADIKPELSK